MKDLYIAASEELIEEYMMRNPGASWNEAYEATSEQTYERYRERVADMIDTARQSAKCEPPKK